MDVDNIVSQLQQAVVARPDDIGRAKLRKYKFISLLGTGGFADVSKYEDTDTKEHVAIKRIIKGTYKSGLNLGAIKELQALQELQHPNILRLYDVFSYGDRVHLVLELGAADLTTVLQHRAIVLTEADIKGYMQQILVGLQHIHHCRYMHRDLKPDNVLITAEGVVKLADFGHASRFPDADLALYHNVVTLWYRAPELLFGAKLYGPAVDMWSIGCIFAEMLLRQPLFRGTEDTQLSEIFRLMGTPIDATRTDAEVLRSGEAPPAFSVSVAERVTRAPFDVSFSAADPVDSLSDRLEKVTTLPMNNEWPGCSSLPLFREYEKREPQCWRSIIPATMATPLALDLLSQLLQFDPARRISAKECLQHPWFTSAPMPTPVGSLPLPEGIRSAKR